MSVDTQQIFRSNHYATFLAMCGGDELCAQKYEFTFDNNLADDMNPVERVSIQSPDLQVGYYVIGVGARSLTESDTQAYGLAAAGGGLSLHDLADNYADLDLDTGGEEPDPDTPVTGTPAPAGAGSWESAAPTPAPGVSSSDRTVILHATPAPALGEASSSSGAEDDGEVTSGPTGSTSSTSDESRESAVTSDTESSGGGGGAWTGSASPSPPPSSSAGGGGAGVSYVGGGDDDAAAAGLEVDRSGDMSSDGGGGGEGGGGGLPLESKVAASVAGAVLLIGIGVCLAVRRKKARSSVTGDETGSFLCPNRHNSSSGGAVASGEGMASAFDGHLEVGEGLRGSREGEMEEVSMVFEEGIPEPVPGSAAEPPGYAMAVASVPEEVGHTTILDSSGVERVVELAAGDEFEVTGFYSAVDPGAVETLVSWGISRDFARVALRRADNDVPAALKIIAEGNMDELLAEDHEDMAREGEEAEAAEAEAAEAALVNYPEAVVA